MNRPTSSDSSPTTPKAGRPWTSSGRMKDRDKRPAAEVLRTVRRGLRRTTARREKVLAWFGGRFVWNASPQDPDAIEILYHATDFRGPDGQLRRVPYDLLRTDEGRAQDPRHPARHGRLVYARREPDGLGLGRLGRAEASCRATRPSSSRISTRATRRPGNGRSWSKKYLREDPDCGEAYRDWITGDRPGEVRAPAGRSREGAADGQLPRTARRPEAHRRRTADAPHG